jgi:hypothetical protein
MLTLEYSVATTRRLVSLTVWLSLVAADGLNLARCNEKIVRIASRRSARIADGRVLVRCEEDSRSLRGFVGVAVDSCAVALGCEETVVCVLGTAQSNVCYAVACMGEDAAFGRDGVGAASKAHAAAFEEWETGIGDGCTVVRKVTDAPSEECVAGSVIALVEMVIRWTE